MSSSRLSLGRRGESAVASYLKRKGMSIVKRGYRCRQGEIDIIAREGDVLCFVEVKTRSDSSFGSAAESITSEKMKRISYTALHYLARRKLRDQPVRFDVVLVDTSGPEMEIELIQNAFESTLAL